MLILIFLPDLRLLYCLLKKSFIVISNIYGKFADIFFIENIVIFFKYFEANNYAIELIGDLQPLYRPIYSLELVKLEILKMYIEANLANILIRFF